MAPPAASSCRSLNGVSIFKGYQAKTLKLSDLHRLAILQSSSASSIPSSSPTDARLEQAVQAAAAGQTGAQTGEQASSSTTAATPSVILVVASRGRRSLLVLHLLTILALWRTILSLRRTILSLWRSVGTRLALLIRVRASAIVVWLAPGLVVVRGLHAARGWTGVLVNRRRVLGICRWRAFLKCC